MSKVLHGLLVLFVLTVAPLSFVHAAEPGVSFWSGAEDQKSVALTIYNVNLGLVKDRRTVTFPSSSSELRFGDVAANVIPSSVSVRSVSDPSGLTVLEQNYEYDLLSPEKLLDKYVGKDVKLVTRNQYTDKEETVSATLLSTKGGPVYRIGDEISLGHPGRVVMPAVPDDLIARPTLVWLLKAGGKPEQTIEATYLTDNITWRADYNVILNEKDDRADLSGWVTIDNKSGATYRNAELKLVAGDVHRVRDEQVRDRMVRQMKVAAAAPEAAFREEEFFEYHLYTLQRPSTIKDNQTKQIGLVKADAVPVKKELIFKGAQQFYYSQFADPMPDQKIGVFVELQNRKENNLGIPLPKGIVRVYKRDSGGGLQFIGEDSVDHTPKDEKIRLRLGNAFDVVGTRKQTDWKKVAKNVYESSFEITLRNHKKEDIAVKVVEPIPGDWKMLTSSHTYQKTQAFTAEFVIPVPKDGETKLTYTVRMTF